MKHLVNQPQKDLTPRKINSTTDILNTRGANTAEIDNLPAKMDRDGLQAEPFPTKFHQAV